MVKYNNDNPMPFVARMREYFGYRPGQGLREFGEELKALTHEDRVEFAEAFNKMGMPTKMPTKS